MLLWLMLPDTIRISYLLTEWNKLFFEKLNFSKLVKKLIALYGTLIFITVFKHSRTQSLSRATTILSISPFPLPEIILE